MNETEPRPFGASMAWLLDNPLMRANARRYVRRLPVRGGMRVVDVGCGPGRLTVPVARAVGETGEVLAVDLQPSMLERVERRAAGEGLDNVRTMVWAAGDGALPAGRFDVALLIHVLGEFPPDRRPAAMADIASALVPGGALVVAEGGMDPHRQRPETVRALAESAGLLPEPAPHRLMVFRRPATP
jgi:ubiquinone/menaquinone biosynthesis C-methylase UbiE